MPQATYVLPSEESQQIITIFNAPAFSGIRQAERGIVDLRRDFRCRRAANARGGTPHLETASSISLTEVTTLPSKTSVPAAVLISG
jgi:hypothetical protein